MRLITRNSNRGSECDLCFTGIDSVTVTPDKAKPPARGDAAALPKRSPGNRSHTICHDRAQGHEKDRGGERRSLGK